MDWFDNLSQRDQDNAVELLSEGIQHHNCLNEDYLKAMKSKFGATTAQSQQLYELLYSKVQNTTQNYTEVSVQNTTQNYTGVSWDNNNKKWKATLCHNNKNHRGGHFDNKKHAAMSFNLFCDKYKIKRKNSSIDIKMDVAQQKANMDWYDDLDQRDKDNAVEFLPQSIKHYNGFNQDVLMDMEKKFGITPAQTQQLYEFLYSKVPNRFSKDNGVSWIKDNNRWQVQLVHNKKLYYDAVFENKECAAMTAKLLGEKYDKGSTLATIKRKKDAIRKGPNMASKYTGVSWNKYCQIWLAHFQFNKKIYFAGYFDIEEHAAMKVNLVCDKFELERKNPTVDLDPDTIMIRQKTKSKMYRSKAQNIANVEEIWPEKKKYNDGHFDDKVTAAMSENLLSDKYKIKRKNYYGKHDTKAITNAINKIILSDLQQVTKMFKKQNTDEQNNSFLWPLLFDDLGLKTVILAFLITDYDSKIHIIEDASYNIQDMEKRQNKKSDKSHYDEKQNFQDKKEYY